MITSRPRFQTLALVVLFMGMMPFLAACESAGKENFVAWEPSTTDQVENTPPPDRSSRSTSGPPGVREEETPHVFSTPRAAAAIPAGKLTPNDLKTLQPNEIGWIPVMEYHAFTTDPAKESDQFVRTAAHLREDLQFLYEHDFYVIPMRELVRNEITAPAGKHPVVLSFDDGISSQFRWKSDAAGKRGIDPDSAMGVLEDFFAKHPDFGRGGFFAVLPFNCFADGTTDNTADDCTGKLTWMAANGYEIGLHTIDHQDLHDVSDDEFRRQIGENVIWVDERVQGAGNMSRVLVMPFGDYPNRDRHQTQRRMMREGFTYKGVNIKLEGALLVGANPTESPSSATFDPIFIARIQAFKESLDQWFPEFERGAISLYTSDGNPDVVTLPTTIP
ncbi:MAG: polysaccharide deacetylase family protein, partial [Thermomicrobiales bacterium]